MSNTNDEYQVVRFMTPGPHGTFYEIDDALIRDMTPCKSNPLLTWIYLHDGRQFTAHTVQIVNVIRNTGETS